MTKKRSRKRPIVGAGAIPAIFVKVPSKGLYPRFEFKPARIQIRQAKYRYLVWYEERRKHEFYLGAVKALPLRYRAIGAHHVAAAAGAGGIRVGAGK